MATRQGGDASSPWNCVGESSDDPPRAARRRCSGDISIGRGERHNAWVHVPRIGLPSRRHVCNCSLPPPQCPPRFRRSQQRRHPMARGRTDCRLRCCSYGSEVSPTATPRGAVETSAPEHPDRLPHRRLDDSARRAGSPGSGDVASRPTSHRSLRRAHARIGPENENRPHCRRGVEGVSEVAGVVRSRGLSTGVGLRPSG